MKRITLYKWTGLIILLQVAISAWMGSRLPAGSLMPMHWNAQGEVDGTSSVWPGILLMWAMSLGVQVLFIVFPWISPRYREQADRLENVMPGLSLLMAFFFALIQIWSIHLAAHPVAMGMDRFVFVAMGLMFIGIGNLMPKLPQNYFIGIKVPWALNDEENWRQTHRCGGWCFVSAGVIIGASGFLGQGSWRIGAFMTAMAVLMIPILYSYLLFLKKERPKL